MYSQPSPWIRFVDWQRVGAWSVTFAAHLAAIALLALPLAPLPPRRAPSPVRVEIRDTPVPPPAPPAEVLPLPKADAAPQPRVPLPARSAATPVIEAPTAVDAALPARDTSAPVATHDIAAAVGGGQSRELAWATPLRLRYPAPAIRSRQQGEVLLKVWVDASGRAQQVEIARSSGYRLLDAAAREAVLGAHFVPVLRDGVAVPGWGLVPIRFRLDAA